MEDYTILLEYSYIQYFWQLWIFHYHTIFTFITELHKMKHRNYFGSLHVYFIFCNIWKKMNMHYSHKMKKTLSASDN